MRTRGFCQREVKRDSAAEILRVRQTTSCLTVAHPRDKKIPLLTPVTLSGSAETLDTVKGPARRPQFSHMGRIWNPILLWLRLLAMRSNCSTGHTQTNRLRLGFHCQTVAHSFFFQFTLWADAILFVYSTTDKSSLQQLPAYRDAMAKYRTLADMPMILVGTKVIFYIF